jgi:hypothetical protein
MANKMDSVPTIKWWPKPFLLSLDLITVIGWRLKMQEYNKPPFACLDGWLEKIWSSSNHHNFLDGDQPKFF